MSYQQPVGNVWLSSKLAFLLAAILFSEWSSTRKRISADVMQYIGTTTSLSLNVWKFISYAYFNTYQVRTYKAPKAYKALIRTF